MYHTQHHLLQLLGKTFKLYLRFLQFILILRSKTCPSTEPFFSLSCGQHQLLFSSKLHFVVADFGDELVSFFN